MSVFTSAARCLASLANLGQQGAGLGLDFGGWSGSEPGAEGWATSATNTAADLGSFGGFIAGRAMSQHVQSLSKAAQFNLAEKMGGVKGMNDFAKGVSIISWTMTTVQLLQLTTGFGTPYDGASLKTGSQQFTTLAAQLKSALPDTDWVGDASEAYAGQDKSLQSIAQTMADLDNQLAALVKNQADWVTHMQLAFGILNALLATALIIEMVMTFAVPAPVGPIAAKAFAITVASLGISAAVAFLGTLLGYSIENGKKADALASSYAALAAGTVQNDSVAQSKVAASGGSTVSSFETISAGLSTFSAVAGAPTVASPPADERPKQSAAGPGGAAPAAPPAPAAPAAPAAAPAAADYASSSTPTGTMPTLVQAAAMSGQATNLSSRVSRPESMVSQAKTQLQDIVTAQEQEPVLPELLTEAPSGYGAAGAGAGTAGVAPIEVTPARDEPAQRPTTA